MPFSFSKFKRQSGQRTVYRKIIKRFILLFIFGMIVQGNLLGLDPKHLYLYSNTLQAIATGYLIAAIIQLHCNFRWQLIVTALLLLIYWIPMTFLGDFTPEETLPRRWTGWYWGIFRDGVFWNEDGSLELLCSLQLHLDLEQPHFRGYRDAGSFCRKDNESRQG